MTEQGWVYEEDGVVIYRASSLGSCLRSMVACHTGETASPFHANIRAAMDESSAREQEAINTYQRVTGHDVIWQQKTVELPIMMGETTAVTHIVRGHIDGLDQQDDCVIDIKSLSAANFADYNKNGLDGKLKYLRRRYHWQGAVYAHATNRPFRFVIFNKGADKDAFDEDTLIIEPMVAANKLVAMEDIASRIQAVEQFAAEDQLPDCDANCKPGDPYEECHFFAAPTQGDADLEELLAQYNAINELIKESQDHKDSIREQLIEQYGVGKYAAGVFNLRVEKVKGSRFDVSWLKKQHMDIYEQGLVPNETVRVTVTGPKKEKRDE